MPADIVVVANKWWEAAPLLGVLRNPSACPDSFGQREEVFQGTLATATSCDPAATPRLRFRVRTARVAVWCLQDLMNPSVNGSLTSEKARVLPRLFEWETRPRLVIAFGTAADPQRGRRNGTAVVGSSVFIHNPYARKPEPKQQWEPPRPDQLVPSDAAPLIEGLPDAWLDEVARRTLTPPNAGAPRPGALVGNDLVSVGVVNVTNHKDYDWTDQQSLDAFAKAAPGATAASMETTHGVIRSASDNPFLYVSGYVNGVGEFQQQTASNPYSQNFAGAHNAGVALAWLLDVLAERV